MGERTDIAWTQHTWNPWQGCHRVSPGCAHCYMFRDKTRFGQNPAAVVRSAPRTFRLPLRLRDPAMVFTCSWSDWFIEEADEWRDEAWAIIRRTPHLTYQILTKRPERIQKCLPSDWGRGYPNVWLGVTTEDQRRWDERVPILAEVPALIHFASAEPLLGSITPAMAGDACPVDWVILGAESGDDARRCDNEWMRHGIAWCQTMGIWVFVKQLHIDGQLSTNPAEWPEELRVREWPTL